MNREEHAKVFRLLDARRGRRPMPVQQEFLEEVLQWAEKLGFNADVDRQKRNSAPATPRPAAATATFPKVDPLLFH